MESVEPYAVSRKARQCILIAPLERTPKSECRSRVVVYFVVSHVRHKSKVANCELTPLGWAPRVDSFVASDGEKKNAFESMESVKPYKSSRD